MIVKNNRIFAKSISIQRPRAIGQFIVAKQVPVIGAKKLAAQVRQ
jgi:hypothetical protein